METDRLFQIGILIVLLSAALGCIVYLSSRIVTTDPSRVAPRTISRPAR